MKKNKNRPIRKAPEEEKEVSLAAEALLLDAKKAATGDGEYETYDEVFGEEE